MPRQRSLVTAIRDLVQHEVHSAIESLLGSVSSNKPKAKNGQRRRKGRGKSRPGGPGRPPKTVAEKTVQKKIAVTPAAPKAKNGRRRRRRRRGPGQRGSRTKAA